VPVTLSTPHRPLAEVAVKILALVAGIADLRYIPNLAWGEVSRIELTVPDAEIAFTAITTHSGGRAGLGGGISSGSSWNASSPFLVFPTRRKPAFSYV